jgi:hypothetical protein
MMYSAVGRIVDTTSEGYTVKFEDGNTVEKMSNADLEQFEERRFLIATEPVRMKNGSLPHHVLKVKLLDPALLPVVQAFALQTGAVLHLHRQGEAPEYGLHYTREVRGKLEWAFVTYLWHSETPDNKNGT